MTLAGRHLIVAGPVARPENATLGELDRPLPSHIHTISPEDGGTVDGIVRCY